MPDKLITQHFIQNIGESCSVSFIENQKLQSHITEVLYEYAGNTAFKIIIIIFWKKISLKDNILHCVS